MTLAEVVEGGDGDGLEADEAGDGHKRPRLRGTS